jgi:hypothetical protein
MEPPPPGSTRPCPRMGPPRLVRHTGLLREGGACSAQVAPGPWSATDFNSINILAPPAPAAPGGVSAGWGASVSNGGGVRGTFSAVAGATVYEAFASFVQNGVISTSNVRTFDSAASSTFAQCNGPIMSGGAFHVRAGNGSGFGPWTIVEATRDSNLNGINGCAGN